MFDKTFFCFILLSIYMTVADSSSPIQSFFEQFSNNYIFHNWHNSQDLLQLAQSLGFNNSKGLAVVDYCYIEKIKTRTNWHSLVLKNHRNKERARFIYIKNLSAQDLQQVLDLEGITTVSHLALHF